MFKSSFAKWRFACAVETGGKRFCFYYLMDIILLLFLNNDEITWTVIRNTVSDGYSIAYCDSEIKTYSVLICC